MLPSAVCCSFLRRKRMICEYSACSCRKSCLRVQAITTHFFGFCKLLIIRCQFWRKIQGTYFKISALYFKIYGLYFLQDALCFLERPERGEKHGVILENKKVLTLLSIFSVFFIFEYLTKEEFYVFLQPININKATKTNSTTTRLFRKSTSKCVNNNN